MYRYWRFVEGPRMLDIDQMYFACAFWPTRAAFDRGDQPSCVSDFRMNEHITIGSQRRRPIERDNAGTREVQLIDDSWMSWDDWTNWDVYEGVERGTRQATPRPEPKLEVVSTTPESHVRDFIEARLQIWVRQVGDKLGDDRDPDFVGSQRPHPTDQPPLSVRQMPVDFEDTDPEGARIRLPQP